MARPRENIPQANDDTDAGILGLHDSLINLIEPARPKTSQVYAIMRRAIVNLHLAPGSNVTEKLICEQLGIFRTPLREAILHLQSEKLVSVIPKTGTYVSKIDLHSVFDAQLVRSALALKAVRLAASRMTAPFERSLNFNLHQQKWMAANLDYDGFYELDEAFHTMIRRHIVEWRDFFGAGAGGVLGGCVNGR